MKIAITGGNGFIGSVLSEKLIKTGYKTSVIDFAENLSKNKEIKYIKADVCSLLDLKKAFNKIDCVVHLAAYSKIKDCIKNPDIAFRVNVGGTINVLLAARDCGVKRVIYASSSSVYGDQRTSPFKEDMPPCPLNSYAATKFCGEKVCVEFPRWCGVEVVSLRLFNVYGSENAVLGKSDCPSVIEVFLNQKRLGKELTIIGNGKQKRDFVYVGDVASAFISAVKSDFVGKGEIINIGSGAGYSVSEIAKLVGGKTIKIDSRYEEAFETLADIRLARDLLGWKPKQDLGGWIKYAVRRFPAGVF